MNTMKLHSSIQRSQIQYASKFTQGQYRCHAQKLIVQAKVTDEDAVYMRRAIDLASTALGKTHPNPAVGCVIVKDGRIVGEGYHPSAGMPHAEVYALRAAGASSQGATAYVTLEPCAHYGRTPPCSKALVAANVARVVVGCGDPNPLVNGGGVALLRNAGIEVDVGCEEQVCFDMNKEFMERIQKTSTCC